MNIGVHTGLLDFKGMAKIATGDFLMPDSLIGSYPPNTQRFDPQVF